VRNGVAQEPQHARIRESCTQEDILSMGGAEIVGTAQVSHLPNAHSLPKHKAKRRRACHAERAAIKRAASERVLQWVQEQSVAASDCDRDLDRSVAANRAWLPDELAPDPEVASTGLHGLACGGAAQVVATRHDRTRCPQWHEGPGARPRTARTGGRPATVAKFDLLCPSGKLGCPGMLTNGSAEPSRVHQSRVRTSRRKEVSERNGAEHRRAGAPTCCPAGDAAASDIAGKPPRQQAAQEAAQKVSLTGLVQIAQLGPAFRLGIPIKHLNLAHDLGQPCAISVQARLRTNCDSRELYVATQQTAEISHRLPHDQHKHRIVLASNISMNCTCEKLEAQFTQYGPVQLIRAEYLPAKRQAVAAVFFQNAEDAAACVRGERDGSVTMLQCVHSRASAPAVQPMMQAPTKLSSRAAGAEVGARVAAGVAAAAAAAADDVADEATITTTSVLTMQLAPSGPALAPGVESSISPPLDHPSSPVCDERDSGCKSCRV
jgi:hypothetical protein